jgi:hypothetical protein
MSLKSVPIDAEASAVTTASCVDVFIRPEATAVTHEGYIKNNPTVPHAIPSKNGTMFQNKSLTTRIQVLETLLVTQLGTKLFAFRHYTI